MNVTFIHHVFSISITILVYRKKICFCYHGTYNLLRRKPITILHLFKSRDSYLSNSCQVYFINEQRMHFSLTVVLNNSFLNVLFLFFLLFLPACLSLLISFFQHWNIKIYIFENICKKLNNPTPSLSL